MQLSDLDSTCFSLSLFQDRNRVRNEFIGLQIVNIFKTFREGRPDPDLEVQLDVFDEQRASDEAHVSRLHTKCVCRGEKKKEITSSKIEQAIICDAFKKDISLQDRSPHPGHFSFFSE